LPYTRQIPLPSLCVRLGRSNSNSAHRTNMNVEEIVCIVDEEDRVVNHVPRSVMRRENLRHRSTFIFVKNSKGMLYVQKRTKTKDYCPGYFDVCTGGVLKSGEEYQQSAERELEEELGIHSTPVRFLFKTRYEDEVSKLWGAVFECLYDGAVTPQVEEVESVHMMSFEEILSLSAAGEPFTPDSTFMLQKYMQMQQEQVSERRQ